MNDNEKNNNNSPLNPNENEAEKILDSSSSELAVEENKVQIISPGRMVLKRFFRSRLSVIGLVTLIVLFAFAFFGPFLTPWGETEADMRIVPPETFDSPKNYIEEISGTGSITALANQLLGKGAVKEGDTQAAKQALFEKYRESSKSDKTKVTSFRHNEGTDEEETIYFQIVDAGQMQYTIYIMDRNVDKESGEFLSYTMRSYTMITRTEESKLINLNAYPSSDHWLGTDEGGYDVLARLMYGGRISLTLGFVVVFIAAFIGVMLGGIAGYFGKWPDLIIMRIIDLIYCLPQLPILLIFSAILDGMEIDEGVRIYFLMGVLSLLGWAGTASLVRGQILALREQEFMVAAEALGISVPRRIIKHLVPNIMPLLIVSMTMSLGGTILTESTLSYLGLGIRPPKAAWGTMIGGAQDATVMEYFPNQWMPAGVLIIMAVLAFNFIGDGLRDAFDPKMKR